MADDLARVIMTADLETMGKLAADAKFAEKKECSPRTHRERIARPWDFESTWVGCRLGALPASRGAAKGQPRRARVAHRPERHASEPTRALPQASAGTSLGMLAIHETIKGMNAAGKLPALAAFPGDDSTSRSG